MSDKFDPETCATVLSEGKVSVSMQAEGIVLRHEHGPHWIRTLMTDNQAMELAHDLLRLASPPAQIVCDMRHGGWGQPCCDPEETT